MAKQKKAPEVVAGVGIPVTKDSFLRKCADALKKPLQSKAVIAIQRNCKMGELYYFAADLSNYAQPDKRDMDTVPVTAVPQANQFWLAISARLGVSPKACYAEHIGIKVYSSGHNGKVLRIRGEWDLRANDSNAVHAQPHWHVHSVDDMFATVAVDEPLAEDVSAASDDAPPASLSDEDLVLWRSMIEGNESHRSDLETYLATDSQVPLKVASNKETEEFGQKNLHLAMSAGWHQDPDHGCVIRGVDEPGVYRWIGGVTGYVVAQLQFVASKLGATELVANDDD